MNRPVKSHQQSEAILLIGPTSAGKTPLGDYMAQRGILGRKCRHFDFGRELRSVAGREEPAPGFSREEYGFIRDILEKGRLLEDEHFHLAEKILRNFLAGSGWREPDLIVLNGLPRHVGQARDMERHVAVTHLLQLECSPEAVSARIDRNTGGDRLHRTDDAEDMIRKKLALYHDRTAPLVEYYGARGCMLISLCSDAGSHAEDLYAQALSLMLS